MVRTHDRGVGVNAVIESLLPEQAETRLDASLAEVLAGVVRAERVPIDGHFFDDLGADSMVMAQFCARVRKRADLPPVSIKDVYAHPTIRSLAAALADVATAKPDTAPTAIPRTAGTPQYLLTGALQVLFVLAYSYVVALAGVAGYEWIAAGAGPVDL
jgi:acyl carrier protein